MYNKQNLQNKLNAINDLENINKKYYHLRSIGNFIYHFDDLGNIELKEKVYLILLEYLEIVKENPIENLQECTALFDDYIRPVGDFFEHSSGFMPMISNWVIIYWIIFFCLLFFAFNLSIIFYAVIGALFLSYYFYIRKKKAENRIYGLGW